MQRADLPLVVCTEHRLEHGEADVEREGQCHETVRSQRGETRQARAQAKEPGVAAPGAHSTQSALNRFVSPRSAAPRLEANTSRRPSAENIGKPSQVGSVVTRARPSPSSLTIQRSMFRPRGSGWFDAKMMRRPSGAK